MTIDELLRRTQQQEQRTSGGMTIDGLLAKTAGMERNSGKTSRQEELSLPTISPEVQVRKGMVTGAAIQTAKDVSSPTRQVGPGFHQVAVGGIEGLDPARQKKRNTPMTAGQAKEAYDRTHQLETELGDMDNRLREAYSGILAQEQQVQQMEQRLQFLQERFNENPTREAMEIYDHAYGQYQAMLREYMTRYKGYEEIYRGYEAGRSAYEEALGTYNDYVGLFVNEDGSYDYGALAESAEEAYNNYLISPERQAARQLQMDGWQQNAWQQVASGQLASDALTGQGFTAEPEDTRERELRALRDYYRTMADRTEDDQLMAADLAELESWSQEDRDMLVRYVLGRQNQMLDGRWNEARMEYAYPLYDKYGQQRVEELAESYSRNLNRSNMENIQKATAGSVKAGYLRSVGHNLASIAASVLGGVPALFGGIQSWAESTGRYRNLDPYNPGSGAQTHAGAVRQATTQRLEGEEGERGFLGKVNSVMYQGMMSALENAARMWVAGGIAGGGNVKLANHGLMALNSATSAVREASAAGAKPMEAMIMGLGSAGIEILTEEISLDRLLSNADSTPDSLKAAIRSALTQAGIEASEEELSFLGNLALEAAVLRERSGYNMRIGELLDGGMSYEEARKTADDELVKEAALTAVTSFISGGMMDGGQNAVNALAERNPTARWERENTGPAAETVQGAEGFQVAAKDGGSATALKLNVSGNVSAVEGVKVPQRKAEIAGALSEVLGKEIVFFQITDAREQGFYYGKDGRIYLANVSTRFAAQTVAHELTHSIESTQSWGRLRDLAMQFYTAEGKDVAAMRESLRQEYEEGGHRLESQDDVDRELVARFVEDKLLTNEKQIREVCSRDRSLGKRIHDWLVNLLAKWGSNKAKDLRFLEEMRDLYAKALRESGGKNTGSADTQARAQAPARQGKAAPRVSNYRTGDPQADQVLDHFAQQLRDGDLTQEEYDESVDGIRRQHEAGKKPQTQKPAEPEIDESWLDFDTTFGEGSGAWDGDDAETREEDEELEGTAPRLSYGGINSRLADMDTLKQAKVLASQGVAYETIRQATGWFRGSDGKWRFEFPDDEMTYDRMGNQRGARDKQSAIEDLKEVRNDLFRDMPWEDRPKVLDWAREEHNGNHAAAQELYDELLGKYGMEFAEYTRAIKYYWETKNAPAGGFLPDYVSHPTLYDHYPELTRVAVKFEPLGRNTRAMYRRSDNTIVLSDSLMEGEEETILHEIQHAIQDIEGFAGGASPEFWAEFQKGANPIMSGEGRIAGAQQKIEEILADLPENVAEQFRQFTQAEKTDPEGAAQMAEQLGEGMWREQFGDYFLATWDLDLAQQFNRPRSADDLYRNTAGEIEARDTAARRTLTPEQRKKTPPDLGGEGTVFAEGVAGRIAMLDAEYGQQMQPFVEHEFTQQEIESNIQRVMHIPAAAQIAGTEFAKGEVDLVTQVDNFFEQLGKSAFNPVLGDVILDRRGVKDDMAHGIGRKKAAAFAAVPGIIEKGLVVDYQQNWKGRSYDTAVIAAPITVGGEKHLAAVVVTRSQQTNRFYLHEVLAIKDGDMPFKTGAPKRSDPGGNAPSVISILKKVMDVKRYSVRVDSEGRELSKEQQEFFRDSKARDAQGRLLKLYHQTAALFTIFNTRHPGAGSKDGATPFGIFLKRNSGDIGLGGKNQMELYANIANPLRATNRADLDRLLRGLSPEYADIAERRKQLDTEYQERYEQAGKAWQDYAAEWRKANPGANRRALYDDPRFSELFDAEDAVVDEWTEASDQLSIQAKEAITSALQRAGYDGIFLEYDEGSWGRKTDAIIALYPEQVKLVTNETPTNNPDIRFSLRQPVEQAGDLVAIHNLGVEELLKSLRIGGMPMPSIAVTRAGTGDNAKTFGKVTVIFRKETVDPQRDPRNKIYGADVVTPVLSELIRSGYRSDATAEEYVEAMKGMGRRGALWPDDNDPLAVSVYAPPEYGSLDEVRAAKGRLTQDADQDWSGAVPMLDAYDELLAANPDKEKALWTAFTQAAEQQKRGEAIRTMFRDYGIELTDDQLKAINAGYKVLAEAPTAYFEAKPERVVTADEMALVAVPDDISQEALDELRGYVPNVQTYENGNDSSRMEVINSAPQLRFSLREPVEQVGDLVAVHNLRVGTLMQSLEKGGLLAPSTAVIKAKEGHADYGDVTVVFHRDTVDPERDPRNRIYGGDVFTPTVGQALRSGLDPNSTPEEYIDAMFKLGRRGVGQDKNSFALMSYAPPEYRSLAEVRADSGRLSMEGMEEDLFAMVPVMGRVEELVDALAGDNAEAREAVMDAMTAAAEQQKRGNGIGEVFREHGFALTEQQQETLDEAFRAWAEYRTPFFEAKPERVVGPDEWALVAVPDNTDPDVLTKLQSHGINVRTYETGNNTARMEVVNSMPELRFSVRGGEEEVQGLSLPTVEDAAGEQAGQAAQGGGEAPASDTPMRDALPAKARDYLAGTERKMLSKLQTVFSTPGGTKRMILQPLVRQISEEYLREGRVSQERLDHLFEEAWTRGVIVDTAYYDQYREIKDWIRTTGLTLPKRDQADIADFGDFRRRAFGTLRIVSDGTPVDTAYGELHTMAPNLFPEGITHPADQLVHIYEVAKGIQRSEQTLAEFYGGESENVRRDSRHEFDNAVTDILGELRTVKRYADDAAAKAGEEHTPPTTAEAMELYKQFKEARRQYERVNAQSLLPEEDQQVLQKLLDGKLSPDDMRESYDNSANILRVYEVKAPYEDLARQIRRYKAHIRQQMRAKADSYLETALTWKDKAVGFAYSRETMERNIRDIVPDGALAKRIIREYFTPVHHMEAEANRFRAKYRDRVRGLNLSTRVAKGNTVSEAHAVQLLGEAMDNIAYLQKSRLRNKQRDGKTLEEWQAVITDLWEQNPNLDRGKIEGAVKEFRKIYDELFQRMNEVRVANGYEPVNYRQGYFPHFQPGDGDGILAAFGRAMGIDTQVAALPTTINGLTHTFKPGITWFGNAQERIGFNTAYDAVEGFDKYIEGVASVIFHTENIQKLRAFATQVRYRASDEGIRKQVDAVWADTRLTDEEKQAMINEIYGKARFTLSNFVTELDEYTNLLANKKSKLDRTVEGLIGRRFYTIMKNWENRVGANMIAGNITSALTNFIPITQAAPRVGHKNMLKGMWGSLKALKTDDGITGASDFLTNRRGNDPLVKKWTERASAVLGMPMELIDNFTSGAILRAAYYDGLSKGLSEQEAMERADSFAAGVMADRSKGAMPTLFESKNPVFKMFTQFQLEVNNQWSEIFKDLPAEVREQYPASKGKQAAALALTLFQYFLGALMYNEVYEYFVGRRPALDPFGILNDTVGDLAGYELPNVVGMTRDLIAGEEVDFETEQADARGAMENLRDNVLGSLPFSSALTLAGVEIDGGRIPAASAIPDFAALFGAAFNKEWSDEKRLKEVTDELWKLSYVLPPFGGNQLQKIWKGLTVYFNGGSYTATATGEELQYPVFRDDDGWDWMTAVQAAVLGKSSLREAQDWVANDFDSLGTKQTAIYRDLLEVGIDDRDAWGLLKELSAAEKDEAEGISQAEQRRRILMESGISGEGKTIVYYGWLASDSERELMDELADAGADQGKLYDLMTTLREVDAQTGEVKRTAQYRLFANGGLADREKDVLAKHILGDKLVTDAGNPTAYADYLNATAAGLERDTFMQLRAAGADMDVYFEAVDNGLRPEDAAALLLDLEDLEPQDGEKRVQDVQRWKACIDFSDDQAMQLSALRGAMSDAQYLKVELASDMGVAPGAYVELYGIRGQYDANGNGNYSNAEVKAAIDALSGYDLTVQQKAVLWQLMTGSSSAKNNPYSTAVGQQVVDERNARKDSE